MSFLIVPAILLMAALLVKECFVIPSDNAASQVEDRKEPGEDS